MNEPIPTIERIPRTFDGCTWYAYVDTDNGRIGASSRTRKGVLIGFAEQAWSPMNVDPEPWVADFNGERFRVQHYGYLRFDPRPEFDSVVNPILALVRAGRVTPKEVLDAFSPGFDQFAYSFSAEHIDHARRVLQKLAALRA